MTKFFLYFLIFQSFRNLHFIYFFLILFNISSTFRKLKNIYYTSFSSIQYNFISDDSIFEEVSIRNVSSNINCAYIDCIKLIIISHIHNNHIVIYIYLVDNLLNFCPYVFICNPLRWIFTKIVHYSLKIFFGGIKSNIFGKVFDDGSNDIAFGWPDYLRNTVE